MMAGPCEEKLEIQKLLAEKRKVRAKWQRSHPHPNTKRLTKDSAATSNPN
jgi:hypothetical protein